MTENEERILRLNAALDGELDAMSAFELERAMRDDPTLAAESRRLTALRDAVRRHAPREAAPERLADRIAALAEPVETAAPAAIATILPFRCPTFSGARMLALAVSIAACGFVAGAGLMSLRTQSAAAGVAAGLVADARRSPVRPTTSPRRTGTRSSPGSPAARPSAPPSSISRKKGFRSRAAASRSSTGSRPRRSSIATAST